VVALAAGFVLQYFFPVMLMRGAGVSALKALAILLLLAGMGLAASAVLTFRHAGTPVRPDRDSQVLVRSGPFRFSRNPMYLSLSLIYAGLSFFFNAVWPLLFLIPAIAVIRYYVIGAEEAYLLARFGAEYESYLRSVRRWL
jgi:protein-S-isoprenylcysteine O-methyltransferase Ste14